MLRLRCPWQVGVVELGWGVGGRAAVGEELRS